MNNKNNHARAGILSLVLSFVMIISSFCPSMQVFAAENAPDVTGYKNGTYEGSGNGRNGEIRVSVTISDNKIESVEVISQHETPTYWEKAVEMIESFTGKNSSEEVESVSGATQSSDGIKAAVDDALSRAIVHPYGSLSGSGTAKDPYIITEASQLEFFASKVDEGDDQYTGAYVILGNDIDLSGIGSWNPIGAEGKATSNAAKLFNGNFDGRGRTIKGLAISGEYDSEANLGLFSTLGGSARVSDVLMTDVKINVAQNGTFSAIRAGGIAGDTARTSADRSRAAVIDGCSVSGEIKASAADGSCFTGGLLGRGFTKSAVINCISFANVSAMAEGNYNAAYAGGIAGMTGNSTVMANCASFGDAGATDISGSADAYSGGLTGMLSSKVYNCYTAGNYSITQKSGVTKQFVGALTGQQAGSPEGSLNYYSSDSTLTVIDENGGSVSVDIRAWSEDDMTGNAKAEDPLPLDQMLTETFMEMLNGNIGTVSKSLNESELQYREWLVQDGKITPSGVLWVPGEVDDSVFESGTGEENDPYIISNKEQLIAFAGSLNSKIDYRGKYIRLENDIDISGENWDPIGGSFYRFDGDFNGNGKTISGLSEGAENSPLELDGTSAYVGLFGWINEHARIHDLTLDNVLINTHSAGSAYVGGIAGRMSGSDTEGDYHGATIDSCAVNGSITHVTDRGTSFMGGIIGHMFKGAIINTMSDVDMDGRELSGELAEVGGMVGLLNRGLVANCYALGNVTGSGYRDTQYDIEGMACVGNIAAVNGGYIVNCYGEGDVEALEYSIDTGVITGWVTGIAKVYDCWYNLDASMTIDGRKVEPVDPFGETVAGGVSDEWGFKFPGSLVDNNNGYHPGEDQDKVAKGLNSTFERFPVDAETIYGLDQNAFFKWDVKDGRVTFSDERAGITYVQPEIEKNLDEEPEDILMDGTWYGRSNDKSSTVSVTVKDGDVSEVTLISGEGSGDQYEEAVSRAKFKARFGDTSNYDAADVSVFEGNGTEEDPYLVESEEQLRYLAESINEDVDWYGVHFKQISDITVSDTDWKPIGWGIFADADSDGFGQDVVALYPFRGIYDGAGYSVKGLKAGSPDSPAETNYMGFFGIVQGNYEGNTLPEDGYRTELRNIRLEDISFYTENRWRSYIGGLAGNTQGGFTIDNCSVSGVIYSRSTEDFAFAGGLAGSLMYGSVTDCSTNVDSSSWSGKNYSYAAGMSAVTNRSTIVNSYTLGNVHADADQTNRAEAGGFIALDGGVCLNCYARGDVEIVSKYSMYLGGFVGMAASASEHRQCYYNSDASQKVAGKEVSEKRYAGKFVNESAEANAQAQNGSVMSSVEFRDILETNRKNMGETLSQIRHVLGADDKGSSAYHSVYYNGDGTDLGSWSVRDGVVGLFTISEQLRTLMELIDKLPSDVTLEDEEQINEASEAYDKLNERDRSELSEISELKLRMALTSIKALKSEAKAETLAKEAEAAKDAAEKAAKAAEESSAVSQKNADSISEALAKAEELAEEAKLARDEADKAKAEAEIARTEAEKAKAEAQQAASDAETAKQEASKAKSNADKALEEAEKAKSDSDKAANDASDAKKAAKNAEAKAAAAKKEAEQAKQEAEEAKAKTVKSVTVNIKTVTAKSIAKAVTKAGGSARYITKIVLGNKVKTIKKGAFKKYSKVTTLTIKSRKLTKKSVKASLKGSKIKTVKVSLGKTALNKKYVKKYKKYFTKKNAGKKVTVK